MYDPFADAIEAKQMYGFELLATIDAAADYDCIIGIVPHDDFRKLVEKDMDRLLKPDALIADLKGIWRDLDLPAEFQRWEL